MAKSADYIPTRDSDFDTFQLNLMQEVLLHGPGAAVPWGYSQVRLDDLTTFGNRWNAAWLVARNKTSRTSADVQEKDSAREAFEPELRQFVKEFLINNSVITEQQLKDMGLPVHDTVRSRTPVPTSVPAVELSGGKGATVVVRFKQSGGSPGAKGRGKPDGVSRIEMAIKIGDPAPPNPEQCNRFESAQRSPHYVSFITSDSGKRAYFFFRFVNTRNEAGPWTAEAEGVIIP